MKHLMRLTIIASLIIFSIAPVQAGQDCIDYGGYIHWVTSLRTPGTASAVAVSGKHLVVAAGTQGIHVVDVSDPNRPVISGSVDIPDYAAEVVTADSYAYVTTEAFGLFVVDISKPMAPVVVGSLETPGTAFRLAVKGSTVFIADYYSLHCVDVSDPTNPVIIHSYTISGLALGVDALGNFIYVTHQDPPGLEVIDISDPATPISIAYLSLERALTGWDGGCPGRVTVAGEHAYVSSDFFGLHIVDIADPANLVLAASVRREAGSTAFGIAVSGSRLYVASENYLAVMDGTDISDPQAVVEFDSWGGGGFFYDVALIDDYAFAANGNFGIEVFNISGEPSASLTGTANTPGSAQKIEVADTHVFIADGSKGLAVFDITDPVTPGLVGTLDLPGSARDVVVVGTVAFMAEGQMVTAVNVENPALPVVMGSVELPSLARRLTVVGGYAFVAASGGGLQVVEITDPAAPAIIADLATPSSAWDVAVVNGRAYLAIYDGLMVVDVTDPANPAEMSVVPISGGKTVGIAVADDYAYAAMRQGGGLQVVDISDPSSPELIGCTGGDFGSAVDVAVSGNYAYLADREGGLQVINVSQPNNPIVTGMVNTPDIANGVAIGDNYIYIATARNPRLTEHDDEEFGLEVAQLQCDLEVLEVHIDVKPGSENNALNCGARGVLPVAILTTDEFDAGSVDHTTVRFGPGEASEAHGNRHGVKRHEADVDGDGDTDLLFHFRIQETEIDCTDNSVSLTGLTWSGQTISGKARIGGVPPLRKSEQPINAADLPDVFTLFSNVPNPFNPSTTISYHVPVGGGQVSLRIYDVHGRHVRTLVDGPQAAGGKRVTWDGRNDMGSQVATGIYFYRMTAPDFEMTKKMILLK